jgi:hypothetical protein
LRIERLSITNYKSFSLSGADIRFTPGINLVVGKNNAGKSGLLQALSLAFRAQPHLSIERYPTPDVQVNPISEVRIELAFSGEELKAQLLAQSSGGQFTFAWPAGVPVNQGSQPAALAAIVKEPQLRASLVMRMNLNGESGSMQPNTPGLQGYATAGAQVLGAPFAGQHTKSRRWSEPGKVRKRALVGESAARSRPERRKPMTMKVRGGRARFSVSTLVSNPASLSVIYQHLP